MVSPIKSDSYKLALTAVGCFFGAGFMSGSELWQFFGRFGIFGIPGLIVSCMILSFCVGITAYCSRFGNMSDNGQLLIPSESKILRRTVTVCEAIFCFFIFTIMTAGASSLFGMFFNTTYKRLLFTSLFAASAVIIASSGIGIAVKIFSFTVPLLGITAVVTSAIGIVKSGITERAVFPDTGCSAPISKYWLLSAFIYASYNFFCSVGAVNAAGQFIKSKKSIIYGSVLCFIVLIIVSLCLLCAMLLNNEAALSDIPLTSLACRISPSFGSFCSFLLLFAMLGASVGVLIPLFKFADAIPFLSKKKILTSFSFAAVSLILCRFGFRELIRTVYPFFGCISSFGMFGLTVNFIKFNFGKRTKAVTTSG